MIEAAPSATGRIVRFVGDYRFPVKWQEGTILAIFGVGKFLKRSPPIVYITPIGTSDA